MKAKALLAVVVALALLMVPVLPVAAASRAGTTAGPSLTITEPAPGYNHATALISGTGFVANTPVTVTLFTPNGPWSATTTTDASGSFSITFGVYMFPCGTVIRVTAVGNQHVKASGAFTIQC